MLMQAQLCELFAQKTGNWVSRTALCRYLGLAESVVQVNTIWICRPKKIVRVQEKQVK